MQCIMWNRYVHKQVGPTHPTTSCRLACARVHTLFVCMLVKLLRRRCLTGFVYLCDCAHGALMIPVWFTAPIKRPWTRELHFTHDKYFLRLFQYSQSRIQRWKLVLMLRIPCGYIILKWQELRAHILFSGVMKGVCHLEAVRWDRQRSDDAPGKQFYAWHTTGLGRM